jgi:cytolysin-activating lysine-acyltransferase
MFFGKKSTAAAAVDPKSQEAQRAAQPNSAAPQTGSAGTAPATTLSTEEAKKRALLAKHVAASFGEIVTLLMRSPADRQRSLQDLEWMVAPALMTGQFAVADAQSKETGVVMPVGAVLWAFVSPEVDKRLSETGDQGLRLTAAEWRSGEIPWIVMAIGEPKVVGGLLQQLAKTVFKGKPAKIRARGADGKMVVGRLEVAQQPSQPAA